MTYRYDWPARSTEQVKIKVKNCIDEYKQTIKYNQEYKTCPYFKDIDDIFGTMCKLYFYSRRISNIPGKSRDQNLKVYLSKYLIS